MTKSNAKLPECEKVCIEQNLRLLNIEIHQGCPLLTNRFALNGCFKRICSGLRILLKLNSF